MVNHKGHEVSRPIACRQVSTGLINRKPVLVGKLTLTERYPSISSQPEDFSEQRQVLRPEDHNDGDEIADCNGSTTHQNTDIGQAFIAQTQIRPEAESDHAEVSEGSRNRYDRARIGGMPPPI
jgi:hypothetical protein